MRHIKYRKSRNVLIASLYSPRNVIMLQWSLQIYKDTTRGDCYASHIIVLIKSTRPSAVDAQLINEPTSKLITPLRGGGVSNNDP